MKAIFLVLGISSIWPNLVHADLESFVTERLQEFPDWVIANGLDPFPYFVLPSGAFTPTGPRNITLQENISQAMLHKLSNSPAVGFRGGDLDEGYFQVENPFPQNFSASGIHKTLYLTDLYGNGTAQGTWVADFNRTSNSNSNYYSVYFKILPSGYLQILYTYSAYATYTYPTDIYFEGLSDNPALVEIRDEMTHLLQSNLALTLTNLDSQLITRVFGRYWTRIFLQFTAQDIIDHKLPSAKTGSGTGTETEQDMQDIFQHSFPHPN